MAIEERNEGHVNSSSPSHVSHAHNFIFAYLFLCVMAVLLALVYTSQHKKVTDLQQQIQTQQTQIGKLQAENNQLKAGQAPTISSDYSKGVYLSGTVTTDSCTSPTIPIGDVGCYLVIDSTKNVQVLSGNMAQTHPWGQYMNPSAINVGKSVNVYAHQLAQTQYTLEGSSSFYVKITN
jgi:hypothetical protein